MRPIILASQSPRRRELLNAMGVSFDVMPSDYYEELDDTRTPEAVAEELGLGKAMVIAREHPGAIVIGSDTIVTINGRQLAKAESLEEARAMLHAVTLHANKVTSSLAVVCLELGLEFIGSENAWVHFKPYDAVGVETYLKTGDYKDKAGAYGIQSGAAPLVERITGNADTIVGLPTHLLAPQLHALGFAAQAVNYQLPASLVLQ